MRRPAWLHTSQTQDKASAFIEEALAPRHAPGNLPRAYAAATAAAAGQFQMLFRGHGAGHEGDVPRPRLRHRYAVTGCAGATHAGV